MGGKKDRKRQEERTRRSNKIAMMIQKVRPRILNLSYLPTH